MEKCSLCRDAEKIDFVETRYAKLIDNNFFSVKERCIKDFDKWTLIPTIGSFVKGYVLAVNKVHYISLYDTPKEQYDELIFIMDKLKSLYAAIYKKSFVCFEHGVVSTDFKGSSCVAHVHLHFLPHNDAIFDKLKKSYALKYYTLNSLHEIKQIIDANKIKSYLILKDVDTSLFLIDSSDFSIPSQFFRMILYKENYGLDDNGWDWRNKFFLNNMKQTYRDIRDFFESSDVC